MITTENYFETTASIDFTNLPEALRNGDKLTRGAAQNDWSAYKSNDNIQRVVDAYIAKLNEWMGKKSSLEKKAKAGAKKKAMDEKPVIKSEKSPETVTDVEKITPEIACIKRYVGMHGKTKDRKQILNFINSLQRAIVEKRIRKASLYAKEIENIQEQLIACYDMMGESILIKIDEKTYNSYLAIAGSEKALLSIALIKQFIGLHGKKGVKEKAQALSGRINKALKNERITDSDPYIDELQIVTKALEEYLQGRTRVLEISSAALNGLMGIAEVGSKKKVPAKAKLMKKPKKHPQKKALL